MDIYPVDINKEDPELVSSALILLAKDYINEKDDCTDKVILDKKEEIRKIIDSTPSLEL